MRSCESERQQCRSRYVYCTRHKKIVDAFPLMDYRVQSRYRDVKSAQVFYVDAMRLHGKKLEMRRQYIAALITIFIDTVTLRGCKRAGSAENRDLASCAAAWHIFCSSVNAVRIFSSIRSSA